MEYTEVVKLPRDLYERANRLLVLPCLEEMTDSELSAAGANTNVREGLFYVKFKDNSELSYDLCSGTQNYYDDVVWSKGNQDVVLECTFDLDDIEFSIDGNEYSVRLELY